MAAGRDVTIVSREHVWQASTDLTSGHDDYLFATDSQT
jgi:hypothetical protein